MSPEKQMPELDNKVRYDMVTGRNTHGSKVYTCMTYEVYPAYLITYIPLKIVVWIV